MTSKNLFRVGAVIVAYYPDEFLPSRISAVSGQVSQIVVVDNTPENITAPLLSRLESIGYHVIKNDKNLGVARALNQGISWLAEQGFDGVLTLDQDSIVYPGLVKLYTDALTEELASQKIGVLNTQYRDVNTGTLGVTFSGKKIGNWMDVEALITSGSFFSMETYRTVGPLRDDFLLDWADHDFCLRARAKGLRNFIHRQPYLDHALGNKKTFPLFFGLFSVTTNNHAPFRCYLIGRNLTVLLKKNFFREIRWSIYLLGYLFCKFFLVLCFEDDKLVKLSNLSQGIWDGLCNVMDKKVLPG